MANKRILLVDDDPVVVDLLTDLLGDEGYEVQAAKSGAAAVDLIREMIFDAAILDFRLPDMNGVALHRLIRQMDEELGNNTLFTSGVEQTGEAVDYYESFGLGFLAKPFEVHAVLGALNNLWAAETTPASC